MSTPKAGDIVFRTCSPASIAMYLRHPICQSWHGCEQLPNIRSVGLEISFGR